MAAKQGAGDYLQDQGHDCHTQLGQRLIIPRFLQTELFSSRKLRFERQVLVGGSEKQPTKCDGELVCARKCSHCRHERKFFSHHNVGLNGNPARHSGNVGCLMSWCEDCTHKKREIRDMSEKYSVGGGSSTGKLA